MKEFLWLAYYILSNTDLEQDDPRLDFVECIKAIDVVPADFIRSGPKRLQSSLNPTK